jgi:DNA topoisomerase-3
METAGKLVDNEELRDALKENGIGRPSTRAAIIETLFKRDYIRKEKKNLIATNTGLELIQTIQEDLLKSAELTGIWEKKLRQVERGEYQAKDFLDELKTMVTQIVYNVKSDNRSVADKAIVTENKQDTLVGTICPLCGKGVIIKGKSAYGCSEWKNGCGYRVNFK